MAKGFPLTSMAALAAAALALAVPAIWNGFPLLYWDSADYIAMPVTGVVPMFRAGSYALITSVGLVFDTLWGVIAVQALLLAYLVHESVSAFVPRRRTLVFLALMLLAVLLTGLPWYASQLMADAFAGPLVLGLAALAFAPFAGWGPVRRAVLILALGVAAAVHSTHVALGLGLLLVFWGLLAASRLRRLAWLRVRPAGPTAVVAAAMVLAVGVNWAITGRAFMAQPIGILTFARMVQDGSAKRYLDEVCPTRPDLRMCAIRDRLPATANLFLWMPGPFYEIGGWSPATEAEAERIVADSLRRDPLVHLANLARLTWQQFWMIRSGEGLINLDTIHPGDSAERNPFMPRVIGATYPEDLPAYRQCRQRAAIELGPLNRIQVPLAFAGIAAVAGLTVLGFRRRDRLTAGVGLTVLLALVGNAFICGALSNPADRYQGRIAWIALAALALFAACRLVAAERGPEGPHPAGDAAAPPVTRP